eukprot:scaffold1786_cov138-Cylindrotheca_fusiformis.AAC.8
MIPFRSRFLRNIAWVAFALSILVETSANAVPNPDSLKNAAGWEGTGRQQTNPCLLLQVEWEVQNEEDENPIPEHSHFASWKCQMRGKDATADGRPDRHHVLLDIEGLDMVLAANNSIQSGITTLFAEGAILEDRKLRISPENSLSFGTYKSLSPQDNVFRTGRLGGQYTYAHYSPTIGSKTVLAVRVKTRDGEPTAGMAEISDSIFGTSGDIVNLKSQMEGCSYGKLKIEMANGNGVGCTNDPAYTYFRVFGDGNIADCSYFEERDNSTDYCRMFGDEPDATGRSPNIACCICGGGMKQAFNTNEIVNGVIEIQLDLTIAENDCFSIEQEAVNVLEAKFDGIELFTMFDHVMLCLPPGTKRYGVTTWRAYAYIHHYLQIYHDDWCTYPKTQVHEMSHNLGLAHSWISQEIGFEETVMGSGFRIDEGPIRAKVCFNPSKSYQLGWYDDKSIQLYPETETWTGKIVGVGNYDPSREDAVVIIKIAGKPGSDDYYIGFNHAIGYHIGTSVGVNKVKIVRQGMGFAESWMEALLGSGESHIISNYLGSENHLMIRVAEIDEKDFALLEIGTFRIDDPCEDSIDFVLEANDTGSACDYFVVNEQVGCPLKGLQLGQCSGRPCTAREACCHCGGGSRVILFPSSFPTMAPSITPSTVDFIHEEEKRPVRWFMIITFWLVLAAMIAMLLKLGVSAASRRGRQQERTLR